jgi:hypothetical protein
MRMGLLTETQSISTIRSACAHRDRSVPTEGLVAALSDRDLPLEPRYRVLLARLNRGGLNTKRPSSGLLLRWLLADREGHRPVLVRSLARLVGPDRAEISQGQPRMPHEPRVAIGVSSVTPRPFAHERQWITGRI